MIAQNGPLFESRVEPLTAYQLNLLRAVADGVSTGFMTSRTISRYKLGSSANVISLMRVLTARDYIQENDGAVSMTDPVMSIWLTHASHSRVCEIFIL